MPKPTPHRSPQAQSPKPWGLAQLLAVVVGGYAGLVAYGALAGGQGPSHEPIPPDRGALFVSQLKAEAGPQGLLLVHGQLSNRAKVDLKGALLAVRLRDGQQRLVTTVLTQVGAIPAGSTGAWVAKVAAQGAHDLEVEVQSASFARPQR